MKLKKIAALTALALVPGISSATVGYFAHGYGMKSIGMGGVGIALAQDTLAAASNPAGMAQVGDRYDVGLSLFRPDRSTTITGGNLFGADGTYDGNGDENFFIPEFGYNRMISSQMSLGVSVYGNGGMNTSYDRAIPVFGSTPAGVDLSQLFIAPTVAYKINEQHSVGASLNVAYQRFKATGLENFAAASSDGNNLTNRGYDDSTGFGVRLGWQGEIAPGLILGATWQSKTDMSEFEKYRGLFAEQGDFDIPENYGLGISFRPNGSWLFAFDVMEIKYSGVAAIANPSLPNLGNGLGNDNGAGFGWQDMTVYKLGIAYTMNPRTTLRVGYATGDQPIGSGDTLFNVLAPGVVEDHLTLGATFTLEDRSEVTVGYMHAFENSVNGANSIIPGGNPLLGQQGGGEANLRMSQDAIGVAYARRFK